MRAIALILMLMSAPADGPRPLASAPAQPPTAVVSRSIADSVPVGTVVTLDARGSTGQAFHLYTEADADTFTVDPSGLVVTVRPRSPGRQSFTFLSFSSVDGKLLMAKSTAEVVARSAPAPSPDGTAGLSAQIATLSGTMDSGFDRVVAKLDSLAPFRPNPPPTPTPTPTPQPPPPVPVSFARPGFVTLVVDSRSPDSLHPAVAAIRDSTTIGARVATRDASWLTLDVNSPEYARRNLAAAVAAAGGPPCVVVQGAPVAGGGGASPAVGRPFRVSGMTEDQVLAKIDATIGGQ